jgi:hypothetical protein
VRLRLGRPGPSASPLQPSSSRWGSHASSRRSRGTGAVPSGSALRSASVKPRGYTCHQTAYRIHSLTDQPCHGRRAEHLVGGPVPGLSR